ncbi:hypothetical protein GLOTRDRAFT_130388 [Gloeophyllum trabeum ATCC 11539]|uniref:Uncharacterized protein n=1 Tax=Gloeophyllum trabeum (strain ATCC 11539 / FP-39264 / Madison 617) TaxID=670483 RepID=S7Q3A5_GLOTA|nr:uncharacterized protein GLOTRDRAFT_130388 [Gloeophyllum trabeum ATCC 11539]EPQ53997.1 hypothetical protein GLOTRDRAFT_130388 [Gloeophyllum trabeum ATCC 11539]
MLHVINRIDARVTRSSRNPVTEEFRVIFFPDEQDRDKVSDESVRSQAMRLLEDETKANSGELTGQETFEQFMSGIDATRAANRASREKAFLHWQMQNAQDIEYIINRQGRNELFDERMTLYENIVKQQLSVQDARSSGYLAMMMTAMDKADRMQVDASSHMKEHIREMFVTAIRPRVEQADQIFVQTCRNGGGGYKRSLEMCGDMRL